MNINSKTEVGELKLDDGMKELFNSAPIRFIHSSKHQRPVHEVMSELVKDIDKKTGRLNDPEKWGINQRGAED